MRRAALLAPVLLCPNVAFTGDTFRDGPCFAVLAFS